MSAPQVRDEEESALLRLLKHGSEVADRLAG
jgi:hypothetical protein